MPLLVFRHEDGADEVLVEFDGEDGVEFVGGAEGQEVETNRVGEGDVAVVQILRGSADGCERSRAHAVVRGLKLAGERLRRGDRYVCGRELQRAEAGAGGRNCLGCGWRLGRRSGGWGRSEVVALRRGCADDAEQSKRKSDK